jgi:hypothetical protein
LHAGLTYLGLSSLTNYIKDEYIIVKKPLENDVKFALDGAKADYPSIRGDECFFVCLHP